jgi:hypothetical protein
LLLLLGPQFGQAAANKKEVRFYTADKVELHGTFYPSNAGNDPPCVLLIHRIGSDRNKGGWDNLATVLQKDYAVLSFDLRGHGESINVDPAFWSVRVNQQLIRGASLTKTTISWKDFSPAYYPWLANDIEAAKSFLDEQNNAHACNSANVTVIGAEEGAALGALWIAVNWYRPRQVKNAFGRIMPGGPPESEDISCCVWLSIPAVFSGGYVEKFLTAPTVAKLIPTAFVFGKEDQKAATTARAMYEYLHRLKPKDTLDGQLPKAGKGSGADLLGKESLGTEDQIAHYISVVLDKRASAAWAERANPKDTLFLLNLRNYYPNLP